MKAAAFEYSRPADIDEACALLAADDGARIVAGGQTLVPLMAMRLARPTRLIDIARIPGLAYVRDEGSEIAIGATTRQVRCRKRSADPGQAAASSQGDAGRRPHRDARAGHGRRLARQRRSRGGDRAGRGDARRHAGLARGRPEHRDAGGGFLPRPDDHGAAARGVSRRGALPGLAGAAGGRGLPRDQRAAERFRFCLGRGAGRARSPTAAVIRAAIGVGAATTVPLAARRRGAGAARPSASTRPKRATRCSPRSPASKRWPTCTPPPNTASASPRRWPFAPSPTPSPTPRGAHEGRARHQPREAHRRGRAAHEPARLPARQAPAHRRPCRLRAWRLRRLHRADRWRGGPLLPDVRGAGRRLCHHHHRRAVARTGRVVALAGCVLRNPRHAMRLLHAGDGAGRARAAVEERASRPARRSSTPSPATSAAAPATRRSSRPSRSPPSGCAAPTGRRRKHERAGKIPLRLVRPPRARGSPLRGRQGPLRRRYRAAGRQARRAGDVSASGRAHRLDRQDPRRWRCPA